MEMESFIIQMGRSRAKIRNYNTEINNFLKFENQFLKMYV